MTQAVDPQHIRTLAAQLNGQVWALLETPDRSGEDDLRMRDMAHGSLTLWRQSGGPVTWQRGTWLVARVCAALGDLDTARQYADQCQALTDAHPADMKDFDHAYAVEIHARIAALQGDHDAAGAALTQVWQMVDALGNPKDQEIAIADVKTGPWGRLDPLAFRSAG